MANNNELKSLFIGKKEVKNANLDNASVDERVLKPGSVNTIHLASGSIVLEKMNPQLRDLLLPNKDVYYGLTNSFDPGSDNPFVTRKEIFTYKTNWREAVETYKDLPLFSSGKNLENDIRFVSEERKFYVWQNNEWKEIGETTSSQISMPSEVKNRKNVSVFFYDFVLGFGETKSFTHDSDKEMNRIVQIKEKILGSDEISETLEFLDEKDYDKSSVYTITDSLMNISSKQILGSNFTKWDHGLVGMIAEDINGNEYRISDIIMQDKNNLPKVAYLETKIKTNYTGTVKISPAIVSGNEGSLIRQKNVDQFKIFENTNDLSESFSNIQMIGSEKSGIASAATIRKNGEISFFYEIVDSFDKPECIGKWNEYIVNYKFGNKLVKIEAESYKIVHIMTSPEDETLMTNNLNNINNNDMYCIAYIEKGTMKPYLTSWCHNFGNPIFQERISLDNSSSNNYQGISLDIKELKWINDDDFSSKIISKAYIVAISSKIISSTSSTGVIATWVNDNATHTLLANWPLSITPLFTENLSASLPKIVISSQLSTTDIASSSYYWNSKKYSIWVVYRNIQDDSIRSILLQKSLSADVDSAVFEANYFGGLITWVSYQKRSLFSDIEDFKCVSDNDFDACLKNNETIPSLSLDDTNTNAGPKNQKTHLKASLVVTASNASTNVDDKQYEILLTEKSQNFNGNSISEWSPTQKTGKFGRNIKIKIQDKVTRNIDHKIIESDKSFNNEDNIHLFFINYDSEFKVPSHIHNKYGCWNNEDKMLETESGLINYEHRIRNFSYPIEYLNFVGVDNFDFDFDDQGKIEFIGFVPAIDEENRGLYFANPKNQCKFAHWENSVKTEKAGPGPRAGFTYFHLDGYAYIQGGYGADGSIDSSMFRLNCQSGIWECVSTNNAPPRVFHSSEVVKNIAYKGVLSTQRPKEDINPTNPAGFNGGLQVGSTSDDKPFVWVKLSNFGSRLGEAIFGSAYNQSSSFHSFYEYKDSIDPLGEVSGYFLDENGDVEPETFKVKTKEGYRDSIINFEFYNLTSGARCKIEDISAPIINYNAFGSSEVCFQLSNISGGSRSTFLPNDQIVISYPDRPAFDHVFMYGGGTWSESGTNGYPDDLIGGVTLPPDTVSIGTETNVGDNDVYRDARTIFFGNIDDRRSNSIDFDFIPVAKNGATYAPVPCVSGSIIFTDYSKDNIGGISNFPNFILLNRSNAFRFRMSYEQDVDQIGRPFSFLGKWQKLDPIKANNGEPIEGLSAWKGAKINYFGGSKPAPKGHSNNPYVESSSIVYFGGFSKSDFNGHYNNSLLMINSLDVNLGWSYIESANKTPTARCGNSIMVINRNIENPEDPIVIESQVDTGSDIVGFVEYNKYRDLDSEVWISSGNNSDLRLLNYNQSTAMNDLWKGEFNYLKRTVNYGTLSNVISFVGGKFDHEAIVDIKLNSSLNSFIVPNGIRTSNNMDNFFGTYASGILNIELESGALNINDILYSFDSKGLKTKRANVIRNISASQIEINLLKGLPSEDEFLYVGGTWDETSLSVDENNIVDGSYSAKIKIIAASENSGLTIGPLFSIQTQYNKNPWYEEFSINDPLDDVYSIFDGSKSDYPNWISPVQLREDLTRNNGDERDYTVNNGIYYPDGGAPFGERRWTALAKLTITIPIGPGSGDHVVFVGVYNNGIKSYVEYFIPNETYFAFNLAFVELSGGLYDEKETNTDGKSWLDVGTGTLHLQMRNILQQPFSENYYPYISKVENVKFVELVSVNWFDHSTEIGIKPFKNTWGSLISDGKDSEKVVYFGGRSHSNIVLDEAFIWRPSSVFIENEKSKMFLMSEIDGSNDSNWIDLNHGNIIKYTKDYSNEFESSVAQSIKNTTISKMKLGDYIDYNVNIGDCYSAWGVSRLTLKNSLDGSSDKRVSIDIGFNIKPNIRDYTTSEFIDLHQGFGKIEFEIINHPFGLSDGISLLTPLLEGELNYEKGKIYIKLNPELKNFGMIRDEMTVSSDGLGNINVISGTTMTENEHVGRYMWIPIYESYHVILSNTTTSLVVDNPYPQVNSSFSILITDSYPQDVSNDDVIFEIIDINYNTLEGEKDSYYTVDSFSGEIVRYIGDKVGGDYSTRIPGWIYTSSASINADSISLFRDDRAKTWSFNGEIYEDKITGLANVSAINKLSALSGNPWVSEDFASQGDILYIPKQDNISEGCFGYYEIVSNTGNEITINTTGAYFDFNTKKDGSTEASLGQNVTYYIMKSDIMISDIQTSAPVPNTVIEVPEWMISEMNTQNSTAFNGSSSSDLGVIISNINARNTYYDGVEFFGKIIIKKGGDEYYQYFLKNSSASSIILTEGDQLIRKISSTNFSAYDAKTDSLDLDLVYVDSITETSSPTTLDFKFDLATYGSQKAIVQDVKIEVNMLYYNDEYQTMNLPIEVYDPSTYVQWKDTKVKVLFSFDNGLTWKRYEKENDTWVAVSVKDIIDQGMEFSSLFDIVSWQWSGWNNFLNYKERNIPQSHRGFIEGQTDFIKIFVGLETCDPLKTPSVNSMKFNFYTGTYWEPKNFLQNNVIGTDSAYLKVKMTSPTTTKVSNEHSFDTSEKSLKLTLMMNNND